MRLRLAVYHVVVFAIVQTLFGFAFLSFRRSQASEQFDECLRGQAKALAQVVNIAENYTVVWARDAAISRFASGFSCAEFYHHIRKPDGEIIESSANLADRMMTKGLPPLDELKRKREFLATAEGDAVEAILGQGGRFRVLYWWHVTDGGQPLVIQIAMSLASLDRANEQLAATFTSISVISLIASGIAVWLIADRAMRPWRQIREEAGKIAVGTLGQRIEVPDADAELSEVTDSLNEVLERMDRAFKAQNAFLTNAAHELQTPVSVLLGEAQILQRKERTKEEYVDYLVTIEEEMRRLGGIIEGMLTLAKTRAGTRLLLMSQLSANDVVMESMENCQALATHHDVQFSAALALYGDDNREPCIRGDRRMLVVMLDNIIRNSIRVSPLGEKIEISVVVFDDHIEISVTDRGPGIPAAMLEEVFKDFKSIPVRGAKNGGAGIGLAIARSVAELHGGQISASNPSIGGACFTVKLPLDHDSAEADAADSTAETETSDS
ncbi:MAG: HAMP domain-containing protein [Phycisphaerales bacterium]|nr:HAMP domain-containing protein [Phycisphaerales bacterium]MCB9863141.1 HAMP domain-containing protein [Phycisphaerales bacterium]